MIFQAIEFMQEGVMQEEAVDRCFNPRSSVYRTLESAAQNPTAHDVDAFRPHSPLSIPQTFRAAAGRSECGERVAVEDRVESLLIGGRTPDGAWASER